MQKIPTIFDRDWEGNRGVIDKPLPECDWVFKGEGIVTEKVDGTNIKVKIENGKITQVWKRRNPNKEQKKQGVEPWYVETEPSDPQDKHIFKAVEAARKEVKIFDDGDYPCEVYGGKIQGNPLRQEPGLYFFTLLLASYYPDTGQTKALDVYKDIPRNYDELQEKLSSLKSLINPKCYAEGIVFHHPDGRMAKIKRKDFKE